jgi:hypothetical protein
MLYWAIAAVTAAAGLVYQTWPLSPSPRDHLVSYVTHQHVAAAVDTPDDLPLEDMRVFSDVACIRASTFEATRTALATQLRRVPSTVRDELLQAALLPETSIETAHQNSSAAVDASGSAYSYLYYIKTDFDARDGYDTCVLASGVEILVAEQIVAYEDITTVEPMGTRPCECMPLGLWCRSCPVTHEVNTRRPVMRRYTMTMQQHRALHTTLVREAYAQLRGMVAVETNVPVELLARWSEPTRHATDNTNHPL